MDCVQPCLGMSETVRKIKEIRWHPNTSGILVPPPLKFDELDDAIRALDDPALLN
jgi:hypothetical protein